ncbi:MAG: type II secretion system minor pseudopilin GspK [Gammaproteobacteria bacterium SHHR-1]
MALIVALLAVALATLSATALISQQQLDIRRTANILTQDQAWEYARGTEDLACLQLQRDLQQGPLDHLGEDWAAAPLPLPIDGGEIQYQLHDLSGRFNLNSLVGPAGAEPLALARFQHLLALLELEPELADALIDWIDPDQEPRPAGAEDDGYLALDRPYRTAGQALISPTELRLIRGFDAEVVKTLQPYVTALPEAGPINVNTAPAAVLASLRPDLNLQQGEDLAEQRAAQGFESLDAFLAIMPPLAGQAMQPSGLSLASRYFLLDTQVKLGPTRLRLFSLLQRGGPSAQVRVLARARGVF